MNSCEDVTAVVVTFNPNLEILNRGLRTLSSQVGAVVVVDNHSESMIDELHLPPDAILIRLSSNHGVAYGHNIGIERARRQGARYVLLMDQDSVPRDGMVRELLEVHEDISRKGRLVAGVGCRYSDNTQGSLSGFVRFGHFGFKRAADDSNSRYVEADFLISSGTLISLHTLDAVGPMEVGLFIDHVDTEWFLRAQANGYRAYGANKAVMEHTLGERRNRFWFLRWRVVPHHAPIRYYYMVRNSILLLRRDYATKKWRRGVVLKLVLTGLYFFFTLTDWDKLRMMNRGLRDGLRGVYGQYTG